MRNNLSQRPKIDVQRTAADYVGEAIGAAGVFAGLALLILVWTDVPERVPRHFLFSGEPTAWSDRWSAVLPIIIAVVTWLGMTLLNRFPHIFNYPWPITERNAPIQYRLSRSMVTWLKTLCVWMLISIVWGQIQVATGDETRLHPAVIIGFLVAIHVTMGVFIYRSYRCRDGDVSKDPFATDRSQA